MKVAVLGAGESGVGAALLALKMGYEIFVSDLGKIQEKYKHELEHNGIPYEEGQHTRSRIIDADLVIKSPGIPDKAPFILELKQLSKTIISEIEFAGRHAEGFIIGITGSNGKTTTTRLLHHLLKEGGINAGMGGNIGDSFARNLIEHHYDYHVLELSSFQLDGIVQFKPDIAILLNITPDHLDRYDYKMENYVRSKFRIAMNQTPDDLLILNADNDEIRNYLDHHSLQVPILEMPAHFENTQTLYVRNAAYDMSASALKGQHNFFNASCAIMVARKLGVSDDNIQKGLNSFISSPHRLEWVGNLNGVDFINDSKATNVDSVFYALEAMERPVIWIAGGTDKGNDYQMLKDLVKGKVKAMICLGKDNEKLIRFFSNVVLKIEEAKSASEAVEKAMLLSSEGDVVLLSPACASFDLFRNYEDRGDQFRAEVRKRIPLSD